MRKKLADAYCTELLEREKLAARIQELEEAMKNAEEDALQAEQEAAKKNVEETQERRKKKGEDLPEPERKMLRDGREKTEKGCGAIPPWRTRQRPI